MSVFKEAGKQCLRFSSTNGTLTVEDLWHMNINDLDSMAINYRKQLVEHGEESFISETKTKDVNLQLRFDITKAIIEERLDDLDKKEKKEASRVKNNKIMELIVAKEDDSLKESSIEELRAMLEED